MDRFGYTKGQVTALRDMDLLYPNTTYVHGSHFTDEEWALVRDSGGNVSFAPQIEVQMGHGWAPAVTALEYGIPIGLSSDVATTASADQFTQMHAIFGSERGRKHQSAWDSDLDGLEASPGLITSRQVLRWATLGGAEVAGIADRTGSITPGKKADIVIIDGSAVNVAPIIDPVGAVVCAADISNVKTVLVDGDILKQDFRLAASLTEPRKKVEASRDYLLSKFGEPQEGWLTASSGREVAAAGAGTLDSGTLQRSVTGDVPRSFGRSVLPPGPTARACSGPMAVCGRLGPGEARSRPCPGQFPRGQIPSPTGRYVRSEVPVGLAHRWELARLARKAGAAGRGIAGQISPGDG